MKKHLRILICPLDWGLGHASRCVPLIRYFLEKGHEVILAADNRPMEFLHMEFPGVETLRFPGYTMRYPAGSNMVFKILLSFPGFLFSIIKEHSLLKKIIKENNIDLVISDNRYGLWTRGVPCVFITHQLRVQSPFAEKLLQHMNYFFIKKYTACWVPDEEEEDRALSGELSHGFPVPRNVTYIGLLSRFAGMKVSSAEKKYDVLVLLSGPEPQRTILEEKLIAQLKNSNLNALIVQGKTESLAEHFPAANIRMVSHLATKELHEAICNSEGIISRPGYSTLMDLACLRKKAIFIPTPGQTEQEYLAKYLLGKKICYYESQDELNLGKAIEISNQYTGFYKEFDFHAYKTRIENIV